MEIYRKERPQRVVYVQLRQADRDKNGRLVVTRRAKTTTLHNATIEQVREILKKAQRTSGIK